MSSPFFPKVEQYIEELLGLEEQLSSSQRSELAALAEKLERTEAFTVVCTHNARRSQMGQLWFAVAADYFDLDWESHSAGTEKTAVHPNVIAALERKGFVCATAEAPYELHWSEQGQTTLFSKTLAHESLPAQGFTAFLVCEQAAAACPFVPGAARRISFPLADPGEADAKPEAAARYEQALDTLGIAILYLGRLVAAKVRKL